jgi:hypothetical protein
LVEGERLFVFWKAVARFFLNPAERPVEADLPLENFSSARDLLVISS